MGIFTGLAVYFVVWWITLFMVLPWGNKPDATVQEGNVASAPAKPRIALKAGDHDGRCGNHLDVDLAPRQERPYSSEG